MADLNVAALIKRVFPKGAVIKPTKGHAMTVVGYTDDGLNLIGSYTTPDGEAHRETVSPQDARTILPGPPINLTYT